VSASRAFTALSLLERLVPLFCDLCRLVGTLPSSLDAARVSRGDPPQPSPCPSRTGTRPFDDRGDDLLGELVAILPATREAGCPTASASSAAREKIQWT
jgi:hypothetical protein